MIAPSESDPSDRDHVIQIVSCLSVLHLVGGGATRGGGVCWCGLEASLLHLTSFDHISVLGDPAVPRLVASNQAGDSRGSLRTGGTR